MTGIRMAEWSAGILAFWIVFAVLRGTIWESEEEREQELRELRRSIGRDANGGEG